MFLQLVAMSSDVRSDVPGSSSDVPGDVPSSSSDVPNDDSDRNDDGLVSITRDGKSVLWTYFGFEAGAGATEGKRPDQVICRTCKKSVVAKGGNTSNMLSHLKVHHPILHAEAREASAKSKAGKRKKSSSSDSLKQTTVQAYNAFKPKYSHQSKKWQQLTNSVTYCLAKDMMPMYSVEKTGFQNLLKTFDPQYELPSRKYFSKTALPHLYTETRKSVEAELSTVDYYSATTDMWSSHSLQPYLSYTIHYVGDDWKLKTRCLQTLYLPQEHTGENISEALTETLESWNLDPKKQVCITTDNGSNMINAVNTHLNWTRLSCFGHNLNLAVENSFKNETRVSRAVGVCRKLVSTFSHSWNKKQSLTQAQQELNLPNHHLVTDCQTRWGSMQKMVSRILEQQKAIHKALQDDRKHRHLLPTWQDIEVLESLEAALGTLSGFTDMLSAENFVTVSAILPVIHHILKNDVLEVADDDTQLTKDIKTRILGYLEQKYDDFEVCELLNAATFLDPRFVTEYIPTSVEVAATKDRLAREGTELRSATLSVHSDQTEQQENDDTSGEPPPKKRKLGSWLKAARREQESSSTKSPEELMMDEIEIYSKITKPDADSNPLDWWKVHGSSYPTLAKLAKKYLCICASSCASERLFSTSGHVASKKRNLLKPNKVNMLVFLARNLQ